MISQNIINQNRPPLIQTFNLISQHPWSTYVADFQNSVDDNDFYEITRPFEKRKATTTEPGRTKTTIHGVHIKFHERYVENHAEFAMNSR